MVFRVHSGFKSCVSSTWFHKQILDVKVSNSNKSKEIYVLLIVSFLEKGFLAISLVLLKVCFSPLIGAILVRKKKTTTFVSWAAELSMLVAPIENLLNFLYGWQFNISVTFVLSFWYPRCSQSGAWLAPNYSYLWATTGNPLFPQMVWNWILKDDNAHPHKAGFVKHYLYNLAIEKMEGPACSPDYSPFDHLWDQLMPDSHNKLTVQIFGGCPDNHDGFKDNHMRYSCHVWCAS